MLELLLPRAGAGLRVLCLGAHSDDIEIGCGATLLGLLEARPDVEVMWVVFSARDARAEEARRGADAFLAKAAERTVDLLDFRDGFFPWNGAAIKERFEQIKSRFLPDVVFTHHGADRHQDHRTLSELAWNTFRDHLVLEYEIPKYDGELGQPNLFVPVADEARRRKVEILMDAFGTQRSKRWFSPETFEGLMRLRGVESASPTGYAEAFHARKVTLALSAARTGTP